MKRVKKGLRVIIRRAMLNKCTQFLCVLVVLGVIATIVVYVLKNNGTIESSSDVSSLRIDWFLLYFFSIYSYIIIMHNKFKTMNYHFLGL